MDISDTIIAKSDQLNAEDLIAGPITVTITGVKRTADEQPVVVEISGGHRPWKPCKSMRRLLILAWPEGAKKEGDKTTYDPTCWIGRSVTLIRDPQVKWAGSLVGGIRVAALSHLKQQFEVALAESKGKKKLVTISRLEPSHTQHTQQTKQPVTTQAHPLAAPFAAMQTLWKKRRAAAGLSVTAADLATFIVESLEGVVSAANARKLEAHTIESIAKIVETIEFELPETT